MQFHFSLIFLLDCVTLRIEGFCLSYPPLLGPKNPPWKSCLVGGNSLLVLFSNHLGINYSLQLDSEFRICHCNPRREKNKHPFLFSDHFFPLLLFRNTVQPTKLLLDPAGAVYPLTHYKPCGLRPHTRLIPWITELKVRFHLGLFLKHQEFLFICSSNNLFFPSYPSSLSSSNPPPGAGLFLGGFGLKPF